VLVSRVARAHNRDVHHGQQFIYRNINVTATQNSDKSVYIINHAKSKSFSSQRILSVGGAMPIILDRAIVIVGNINGAINA